MNFGWEPTMNLLRLVGEFPTFEKIQSGLGPTFYHLSREQVKQGLNVYVISKGYPRQRRFEEIMGVHVYRVMNPYNLFALYELMKLEKRVKIDLVHAHATSGPFYAIYRKLVHSGRMRAAYVVHVHGTTKGVLVASSKFIPEAISKTTYRQSTRIAASVLRESAVWKSADALIPVSVSVAKELAVLYDVPQEKINVVPNGVDLQFFFPRQSRATILRRLGLNPDARIILYLGGFRPLKGPIFLIEAVRRIRKKFEDLKVVFVGNPKHPLERRYVRSTLKLIKQLEVENMICVIKQIPFGRMSEYYSAADALVVPSIYEALGKVALEAMACGTPVIASAVGGLTQLISDDKTGILVRPGDPDELAEAIVRIVTDDDLRKKLSLKTRQSVKRQFTWAHTAKGVMAVYQELL